MSSDIQSGKSMISKSCSKNIHGRTCVAVCVWILAKEILREEIQDMEQYRRTTNSFRETVG